MNLGQGEAFEIELDFSLFCTIYKNYNYNSIDRNYIN